MTTEKAKDLIREQLKRRTDLVESKDFRIKCVEIAKKLGITSREWNENKTAILMLLANKFCSIENELRK